MPLLKSHPYFKWYLLVSPLILVLTVVSFSWIKITPGTPLVADDHYSFILYLLTCIWIESEILGFFYLLFLKLPFFKKIRIWVFFLLAAGYAATWAFGVPACQKEYRNLEGLRDEYDLQRENGSVNPSWDIIHAAIPIFPFLLVSHENYEYSFQRVMDIQCLYFWDGTRVIRIPDFLSESN